MRAVKYLSLLLLAVVLLGFSNDVVRLSPAQRVALPYSFSLLGWHLDNTLSKWTHRLGELLPWAGDQALGDRAVVVEYFRLGHEIAALESQVRRAAAASGGVADGSPSAQDTEVADLKSARRELRADVEEVMESTISAILGQESIASLGEFVFPPVDIRLEEPPMLLVTSQRDRIERGPEVLLNHDVGLTASEAMEGELTTRWGLSALVVGIGGLATFPTSINNGQSLDGAFKSAAHEWVHHYLVARLQPLGLNIYSSTEMLTLNETFADMAGREIGERAARLLKGEVELPPVKTGESEQPQQKEPGDKNEFDFRDEMHRTRLRVDELLAEGSVEEAETYMEERRDVFVENGYHIRKLNQAYFAFHGTYGERGESVSPIAGQLQEFRDRMPDLRTFMATVSEFSSYQQFLDAVERLAPE